MQTPEKLEELAALAENFDPSGITPEDATDLRAIAEVTDDIERYKARQRELVQIAHAKGRSWGRIGIALGTSRQAAQERFGDKVHA